MTKATRIGWVRHGITEWNKRGMIQGITDIPLSTEGLQQARLLADRLAHDAERWNGVYCSDLQRAAQTGEILANKLGIPLIKDVRIRERSFGEAEGTTEPERISRWGPDWRRTVPDQESDDEIRIRGHDFVREFAEKHSGEAWLVVSHGSFLARMLQSLCREIEDSHLLNMSLTVLERREEDGWKPLLHNCTRHLEPAEQQVKS
ncbi:histidine phosphatase family protein [Cohnella terricola]|uniref:Histidine phosphatase family protein n=1 Tax=Cohnella terricola TaxID=1289167 RepID=A0A559JXH3_9BACL|nr:histidine phosphatase family protein [Cohnella terricola]TVY04582.1 histidine phosphatase family protein [Cohnella terricola]